MIAANNTTLLEPNVLYLEEKPPKIVKSKKSRGPAKTKKPRKKIEIKKIATKSKRKLKVSLKSRKSGRKQSGKEEICMSTVAQDDKLDPNDPLYTPPQVDVKSETIIEKMDSEIKLQDALESKDEDNGNGTRKNDKNYEHNEDSDDDIDADDVDFDGDDDSFEDKLDNMDLDEVVDKDDDDDDDEEEEEEDEPLIMLTPRGKGRPRKYPKKEDGEGKIKPPRVIKCSLPCKQLCSEKFNDEQRQRLYDHYWNLSKEERVGYLRKHVKSKRLTRYKRVGSKKRGNNFCYYLGYKKDHDDKDANDAYEDDVTQTSDLVRVCRKHFEATLCVSDHYLKKALSGYQLEVEKDLERLVETIKANKEKEKELSQQVKEILDPETGNLITIDPKDKNKKPKPLPPPPSETKPKSKRVRRKPDEPPPKKSPKPIRCAVRCIHKCHTKFTEEERQQICNIFWSMDFNRRKDYILANIEVKEIETQMTAEFRTSNRLSRGYHTRFFLRTGLHGENKRVCKHFLINTLRTNRTFISNAIEFADKTTGYYTGSDRRGIHGSFNRISEERSKIVWDHINSYPTWSPNKKSKTRYLHHSLSIKKMFEEYKEMCRQENMKAVSSHFYYKAFHEKFRFLFLASPDPKKKTGGLLHLNPNISHYTGDEQGGFWLDPKGERLDVRFLNPAQSMYSYQMTTQQPQNSSMASNSSQDSFSNVVNPSLSSLQLNPLNYTTAAASNPLLNFIVEPSALVGGSNPRAVASSSSSVVRIDVNPNFYENLPHSSTSSMFRML